MKIYKKDDKVIVELDYLQHRNNPYDPEEEKELTHNLIGVIAGEEQGIYQLNDLSYKDSQQTGSPLVYTYLDKDEFIKLCKELEIDYIEYETCAYCHRTIWGSFTYGDKGPMCFNCELKYEKHKQK